MAQWTVEGAFRDSGRETTLLVEAPTADAASSVASERGVVVSGIHLSAATVSGPAVGVGPSDSGATRSADPAMHLEYLLPGTRREDQDRRLTRTITLLTWLAYGLAVVAVLRFGFNLSYVGLRLGNEPMNPFRWMDSLLQQVSPLLFSLLWPAGVYAAATLLGYVRRTTTKNG